MPSHRTPAPRLATVVAVASGLVALGLTGAGLLLPAAEPVSGTRIVGAVVAIAGAGALLRAHGPSQAATALATISVVGMAVCLVSAPASPVAAPWESLPETIEPPGAPEGGAPGGREVIIEPGTGGGRSAGGVLRLPPSADVAIDGGSVVLTLPGGGRITIGEATVDGAVAGVPPAGTSVVVVDGVAGRDDGGVIGPDVALGGVTVERADGSRVVVGDGVLLDVPPPLGTDPDRSDGTDALLAVLLGCFALLAFAPPLVRFTERSGVALLVADDDDDAAAEPAPTATMEEGLADVLRAMLADPDPRTSVIGAYARLLTALAEAGFARRAEEGPHEHLWRSLGPLGVRRQPLHQLAELFVRARFTPRPVTEADRRAAITALADAVGDLRLQATDVTEAARAVGAPA